MTRDELPVRRYPAHPPTVRRHNEPVIVFVTVCTRKRCSSLADSRVQAALIEAWAAADDWLVGYYLIMPHHVHLFCAPGCLAPRGFKRWGGHWKRLVSLARPEMRGNWQRDIWDTQMRDADHYRRKLEYVRQNPVRRGLTARAGEWPYQGRLRDLSW